MDLYQAIIQFWPVFLTFIGGCALRNASSKVLGATCLSALSVIATWTMGYSDLEKGVVFSTLVSGALLGLCADLKPLFADVRELFGFEGPYS